MIDTLCKLLGIREDQAEDALKSERAAREALTRRSFFGVAGALAAGTAFSFAAPSAAPYGLAVFPSYAEWFVTERTGKEFNTRAAYMRRYGHLIEEFKHSIEWGALGGLNRGKLSS